MKSLSLIDIQRRLIKKMDKIFKSFSEKKLNSLIEDLCGHFETQPHLVNSILRLRSKKGYDTVLHLAVTHHLREFVVKLLNLQADINAKTIEGHNCLHLAILNRDLELIGTLLSQGIEVNVVNNKGQSPLFLALSSLVEHPLLSLRVVRLLLEQGADPNLNTGYHTCLEIALEYHLPAIVDLLLEHHANPNLSKRFVSILHGVLSQTRFDKNQPLLVLKILNHGFVYESHQYPLNLSLLSLILSSQMPDIYKHYVFDKLHEKDPEQFVKLCYEKDHLGDTVLDLAKFLNKEPLYQWIQKKIAPSSSS